MTADTDPGTDAAALATIRELVTRQPSLDVLLDAAATLLAAALGADGCLIYRVEPDGELAVAACSPAPARAGDPLRLPAGFGVTGRVAADGIPAILIDDNPRNVRHRELLGLAEGERVSRLCVPGRLPGGSCPAVVAVHARSHREFADHDVRLAQEVADLVALRVQLSVLDNATADFRRGWDSLVAATVTAQEAERRRVAGDLHDGVTQAIASLTYHLSAAELALADGDLSYVRTQVAAAMNLADLAFGETRSAITGLHSPVLDDLGLAAGLVSMARAVPNLPIEVNAQDLDLPEHVRMSLFRIAQEAVQNVVKHAEATKATIGLVKHGHLAVLTIVDDGRGFDAPGNLSVLPSVERPPGSKYGLTGMLERVHLIGGQLSVTSRPGEGTRLEVTVPGAF